VGISEGKQLTTTTKTPKLGEKIDENENYILYVCEELPGVDSGRCYGVVHKKYSVVEMSTSVLANARKFLTMLDRWEREPPDEEVTRDLPDFGPGGGYN